MTIRIAINGFGRIGRCVARVVAESAGDDLDIVAINDLSSPENLAYLLEFDSVHGRSSLPVSVDGDSITIGRQRMKALAEKDPAKLPWSELGIDVVLECTGRFKSRDQAATHLDRGAKRVIISAPPEGKVDAILCMGVNDGTFDPAKHQIVSNASCTTNCLAPQLKVLDAAFGIRKGHMLTVHSYTNDQNIVDGPHKSDPRRGRSAAVSMVPTSSGVTKAIGELLPQLIGKFDGSSVRVPTPDVSMTCLTVLVSRNVTAAEVNDAFRAAAAGPLASVLVVEDRPLVSADFIGHPASAVVDSRLTSVVDGDLIEVQAWYDNEWAFSHRMVDLARRVGRS